MQPSSKAFQQYVACHLHAKKSVRFSNFNGRESNCQFDFRPSFGHNLCFNHPNGSCKPILNVYIPKGFLWHKEFHNPMGIDPCNCSMKIRESIGTPIFKVGIHLEVWGFILSQSPTLSWTWDVIPELPSWPALLQALTLVTNLKLGLRHKK